MLADTPHLTPPVLSPPHPERRLSDLIARAFFQAHAAGDIVTAGHLISALESLTERERELYPHDRRSGAGHLDSLKAHLVLATTEVRGFPSAVS